MNRSSYFVKCFCFCALSFCVHGVMRLSVGEMYIGLLREPRRSCQPHFRTCGTERTHWLFAIFFANKALTPIPGIWFATPFVLAFPSGAWGTTTCAACDGLCKGWTEATEAGESFGVDVVDITIQNSIISKWFSVTENEQVVVGNQKESRVRVEVFTF